MKPDKTILTRTKCILSRKDIEKVPPNFGKSSFNVEPQCNIVSSPKSSIMSTMNSWQNMNDLESILVTRLLQQSNDFMNNRKMLPEKETTIISSSVESTHHLEHQDLQQRKLNRKFKSQLSYDHESMNLAVLVALVFSKKSSSIKYISNILLIVVLAASLTLFKTTTINAKEIDSKQDLQEEESTNLPAEHRTYLTAVQVPNSYQAANNQNRRLYMTTSGYPVNSQPGPHHHHHLVNHPHHVNSGSELSPNHVYIEPNGPPNQPTIDSNIYGGQSGAAAGALMASQTTNSDVGGLANQQGGAVGSVSSASDTEAGIWPLIRSDLPHIRALNVKCEKNHMTVNIVFDRPFNGLVFSKGHYSDARCVHLPANSGQTSVNFDIHLGQCGMSRSDASGNTYPQEANGQTSLANGGASAQGQPNGLYIENTIIIQYDAQVQEIWDQARKLRCTWYDYYEKSVTFRPYNVDMLDAVTANFLGDNIQCWMQIQVGKGPWSSEVAGIVKIGQTMTMVLAIKDDENKFDMLVRNCIAHDGNQKHQPTQLVDEYGCVARPKIMAKFQKVRNFGPAATVVSYAYFQAFKFPDSMNVHFQCVIQVCRNDCPEPACGPESGGSPASLGGSSQGGASTSVSGDYATSGTEIVTHKKPPPLSITGQPYHHHHGMAVSTGHLISERASKRSDRKRRQSPMDAFNESTNVKTTKTIQVVSPGNFAEVNQVYKDYNSTICFTTARFLLGIIVSVMLLTLAICSAIFVLLRERSKFIEKDLVDYYPRPKFVC